MQLYAFDKDGMKHESVLNFNGDTKKEWRHQIYKKSSSGIRLTESY